jgi:DnaJ-class molecular chaperone
MDAPPHMRDPYEVLGVSRSATQDEIKKAYRKLAKELHPDLNPGNAAVEQRFKEVSQAYGILGDADKRKRFDAGEIDAEGQETPHRGFYRSYAEAGGMGGGKYTRYAFDEDFSADDIFSDLFGGAFRRDGTAGPGGPGGGPGGGMGGGRARTRQRGADVHYSVQVGFLEAARGVRKRVQLSDGNTLDVTIPEGTEEGQTLRLKGKGRPGLYGGPDGDAYLEVHIDPHPHFARKDSDVHLELPVSLIEALQGAQVQVPTVHGKVAMRVPPGANSGTTLRLKGKGIKDRNSGTYGDQYVKLKVVLPERPDEELVEFVAEWSEKHPYDPRRKAGLV